MAKAKVKIKKQKPQEQVKSVMVTAQDTIPFDTLYENGLIKIKDGKKMPTYCLAFEFSNTDYLLLKDEDKTKKLEAYIAVLNSMPQDISYQELLLNVPKQDEYLKQIILPDETANNEYDQTYIDNQKKFIQDVQGLVCDTRRFIILSYTVHSLADDAYNILLQQFAKINTEFHSLGSSMRKLSPQEYLEVFHDIYNPFNVGNFMLPADIYKRGTNIKDYIAPSVFNFKPKFLELGGAYSRVFFMRSFAETIDDELIGELTNNAYRISVSKQIKAIDKADAVKAITKRLRELEGDKQTRNQKNAKNNTDYIPYDLKRQIEACVELLDNLSNNEELFLVGIYIMISAESKEELEDVSKSVIGICNRHHLSILAANMRQEDALTSILPLGYDKMAITTYLLSSGVSMLLPFSHDRLLCSEGFYCGKNQISKEAIVINRKDDKNGNAFYLGKSGAGKSFWAKLEIEDVLHLTKTDKVIVMDPEREFVKQCAVHGGSIIKISADTNNFINPFDVGLDHNKNEDTIKGKVDLILSLFAVFKDSKLTAPEKSIIERCVSLVYRDFINSGFDHNKIPTFVEFDNALQQQPEIEAKDLHLYLEMYVTGSVNIFSHRTNVDLSARYIDFDLRDLGANLKKAGMLIVLDFIWQNTIDNFESGLYTWLYADEFAEFFTDNADINSPGYYFARVFSRFRKYGGMATGITQNITRVMNNPEALAMLQNSQFFVLTEQSTEDRKTLTNYFDLSDKQAARLFKAERGEGLLVYRNTPIPFERVYPSGNIIYDTITTDFKDKIKELRREA